LIGDKKDSKKIKKVEEKVTLIWFNICKKQKTKTP
jgi:hypothetical protein